jgi:hypothetical protein
MIDFTKTHKYCKECGKERIMEMFSPDTRLTDGKRNICKKCISDKRMELYFRRKEEKKNSPKPKKKPKLKTSIRKKMERLENNYESKM